MTSNESPERKDALAQLNHMTALLAIVILIASVTGFFAIALTLHEDIWRALLLGIITNVAASTIIYIALYYSLSRVARYREDAERLKLVDEIKAAISSGTTGGSVAVQVADTIPGVVNKKYLRHNEISPEKRDLLQRFLQVIYRLESALTRNPDIRLYCHVADFETSELHPVGIASAHMNDDFSVPIPFKGPDSKPFIIAQAMEAGKIVAKNLPSNHLDLYPPQIRPRILSNLKCVIALPILTYNAADEHANIPIGTVSIDCNSADLRRLGMVDSKGVVTDEINDILKSCASVVHRILASDELAQ